MEGVWLASYVALWMVVLLEAFLLLAVLRHVGSLRLALKGAGLLGAATRTEEGPAIGVAVPEIREVLRSQVSPPVELADGKATMLLFVPAGMYGCDDLLPAIRDFEQEHPNQFQTVLVSLTPALPEQFEVVRKYGIRAPIVHEDGWRVAAVSRVDTAPYALIVDRDNLVHAKLPVSNKQGLKDLVQAYQGNLNGAFQEGAVK